MLVYDVESDGLLKAEPARGIREITKVHCIIIYDTETQQYETYDPQNMPVELGVKRLLNAGDNVCGHNIIGYDEQALAKVYPWYKIPAKSTDTLVLARLLNPTIKQGDFARVKKGMMPGKLMGSHSLESYGYRLGNYKGDYGKEQDWTTWEPEMTTYCKQDVRVTVDLLERLQARPGFGTDACDIEHDFARFIALQMRVGVFIQEQALDNLIADLWTDLELARLEIADIFATPVEVIVKGALFTPKRDNATLGYKEGVQIRKPDKIKYVEFNPNANKHIYEYLIRTHGWVPTEFTDKSKEPKIDDEILEALTSVYPECGPLAKYTMIKKRLSQVSTGFKAWSKFITSEGRIHGYVNSCGAITNRCTHSNPNLAQCPKNAVPYGKRCRSVFGPPPGRVFVGCDAKGLELRLVAHVMNDLMYIKTVLEGDPHQVNADALGLDRDSGKTWFYAFLYGAGDKKLGAGSVPKGKKLRAKFLSNLPKLKALIETITKQVERHGWLTGLGGQRLYSRSSHSCLNLLLQSAGAYVMKKACCYMWERLDFTRCLPVLNVHDEVQFESDPDYAQECGEICRQAIVDAGLYFKLNIPMDGSADIGESWNDTH